jgi:hypothetical protein
MPSSAPVPSKGPVTSKKKAKLYDSAKYLNDLRARRKELGFEIVHWYVHTSALNALGAAAKRENRKIQQYVSLNIWKLIPEDLHPKNIPVESLILPKHKKVRLNLKIRLKPKSSAS